MVGLSFTPTALAMAKFSSENHGNGALKLFLREQDKGAVRYAAQSLSKFYARWIEKRRVFLLVNVYGYLRKDEPRRWLWT